MDLTAMNKKAILVPTPGQTEQEYLGRHLHQSGVFYSSMQKSFDLHKALEEAKTFPFKTLSLGNAFTQYKEVVDEWVAHL